MIATATVDIWQGKRKMSAERWGTEEGEEELWSAGQASSEARELAISAQLTLWVVESR